MKKIILTSLLAILSIGYSVAQTFGFTYKGEKLEDGATVTFEADYDIMTGKNICATATVLSLKDFTPTGEEKSYDVNFVITRDDFDIKAKQICFGGNCWQIQGNSQAYTFQSAKEVEATLIDITPGKYGKATSVLTVKRGTETHTVNIEFTYSDPAGITNTSRNAELSDIYSVDGRLVRKGVRINEVKDLKGLYIVKNNATKSVVFK